MSGTRMHAHLSAGILLLAIAHTATAAPAADIRIIDYRFEPAEVTISTGSIVRWTNAERRTSHSILFFAESVPGEPGLESERLFPGEHWERRFDLPGTYDYGCGPHPEMRGRVIVTE